MKPLRALLLPENIETRDFGPFTDDAGTYFANAAIWHHVMGNAFKTVRFDYYEYGHAGIATVTIELMSSWTPNGGTVAVPIPYYSE